MSIHIQHILDFPGTVHLVSLLGRVTPPGIGYPVAEALGGWMAAWRDSALTRAVRINQRVVRGLTSEEELRVAVRETLQQNGRDLYTLYHHLHRPENLQHRIVIDPAVCDILERPAFTSRGLIIAGLHLSIFDLVLQLIFRQEFKSLVLTLPHLQGGRRVEYERRKKTGANILPASLSALRYAVKYLQRGGVVITGIDRPIPDAKYCPRFFGYPAALPTHHISLALQAQVPIVVIAVIQSADGNYRLMSSMPIEMEHLTDRMDAVTRNAERVLEQAEVFIRMAPRQWNVPLPVWPELPDAILG